jgi:hypothetical protein
MTGPGGRRSHFDLSFIMKKFQFSESEEYDHNKVAFEKALNLAWQAEMIMGDIDSKFYEDLQKVRRDMHAAWLEATKEAAKAEVEAKAKEAKATKVKAKAEVEEAKAKATKVKAKATKVKAKKLAVDLTT